MTDAHALRMDAAREEDVARAFDVLMARHGRHLTSVAYVVSEIVGDLAVHGSADQLAEADIVGNLQRVISALQRFVVDQFVLVATLLIHAPAQPGHPINEASPVDPKSPLRAMMIRAEQLLEDELGAVPRVTLRLAPLYDDLGHNAYLVRQIAASYESSFGAMRGDEHPDTAHVFLHVEDAATAIAHAIEARGQLPHELSLLLAEDEAVTPRQLRAAILRALDGQAEPTPPKAWALTRLYSRFQASRWH